LIQPQNPYSPPQAVIEPEIHQQLTQTNRLLFIWIWLPVAILGAMLTAPANIFSIQCSMTFALPCYLLGVIWASDLRGLSRWLISVVCLLVAAFLAFATLPLDWKTAGNNSRQ
jgi:hypothetical protein